MGHKHQWCSYPPEGEVRRGKTWDELEGDEEEMVTNFASRSRKSLGSGNPPAGPA